MDFNFKKGSSPAFPSINDSGDYKTQWKHEGMSKRLWIATQVTQGMLAGQFATISSDYAQTSNIVKKAYEITDELLKQE